MTIRADGSLECGDGGCELFSKSCCCFFVADEGFGGKGDGLIWRSFGTFAVKGFDYTHRRKGLHLWDHDLTVWVHFCLLESAMLCI